MTWLNEFEAHVAQGRAANSVKAYVGDVRLFAQWWEARYGQTFEPAKLSAIDVRDWKTAQQKAKAAPSALNRRLASMRVFAKWAMRSDETALAPLQEIKFVPTPEPTPRWMPKAEMSRLIAEYDRAVRAEAGRPARLVAAVRNQAVAMLQAGAGLRLGEALGLDVADIQLGERSGAVMVRYGKGEKSRRVPLNSETRAAVRSWLDLRGEAAGPLFTSQKGGRLTERPVQAYFQEMLRRANIRGDYTPHSLRHCFVRRMLEAGVEAKAVQTLAGHSRLEMTLRYGLPGPEIYEEAVEHVFA